MAIERSILDAAARLRRNREPHLVATVVRVKGSAYRRPGARMLLTQFRWIGGSVSGGCLEGDIASKGWWRTRNGDPVVVSYDSRMPDDPDSDDVRQAFGLGCEGVVDVMLERAGVPGRLDALEFADQCIRAQKRGAVVTVIRSEVPGIRPGTRVAVMDRDESIGDVFDPALRAGMLADARSAIATGESCNRTYRSDAGNVDVFVEAILPPPRLFVFGTGHDAMPVVQLAKSLGWDAVVCAHDARVSVRQRFHQLADEVLVGSPEELAERVDEADRAVTVVMSHHYERDKQSLAKLVGTHCRYIGVLGPRARTARMVSELGMGPYADARIHAPVGLEIGAETPQEIALAIISEVQANLARTQGVSLRERKGPIHDRPIQPLMPRISEAVAAAMPDDRAILESDGAPIEISVERTTQVAS